MICNHRFHYKKSKKHQCNLLGDTLPYTRKKKELMDPFTQHYQ